MNTETKNTPTVKPTIPLGSLQDGSPFLIPFLKGTYKDMHLLRASESSCKVVGYRLTDNDGENYSPIVTHFASSTQVLFDETRDRLQPDAEGGFIVERKKNNEKIAPDTVVKEAPTPKTKGRKALHFIELPHGEEFSVADLAEKLGVKKFVVSNEIIKQKKKGVKIIEREAEKSGKRGKPAKVFKLV